MIDQQASLRPDTQIKSDTNHSKSAGKLYSMLRHFSTGIRLHRFDAEKLGDHCLHTTVSDLQIRHFIRFSREWIKVPNRFGSKTRVKSYWLEGDNLLKAKRIIQGGGENS